MKETIPIGENSDLAEYGTLIDECVSVYSASSDSDDEYQCDLEPVPEYNWHAIGFHSILSADRSYGLQATISKNLENELYTKREIGGVRKRCASCTRKLKLTDFACKCLQYYCHIHRYPEVHECPYDYRGAHKLKLEAQNPVIVPAKFALGNKI